MEKTKLIQLLKTLSSTELREFGDFVCSPFYNKNEELVQFYHYLRGLAPGFQADRLVPERVYKAVFPGKKYDDKHLKYTMSFLLKLGEQFIGLKKYQGEEALTRYHILEACIDRQLEKSYLQEARKTERLVAAYPFRDSGYYFQHYLVAQAAHHYFGQKNIRKFNADLQTSADYFDLYFLTEKLKNTCEMLNRKKFLQADYQLRMLGQLQDYLNEFPVDEVPALAIYGTILRTLQEESDTSHFEKLKELLNIHFDQFAPSEMKEMYFHAINYCIRKIRQKEDAFVKEALDLYIRGIEKKLLYERNYLTPWTFTNIVKLGLRLQQYDWTEGFIQTYYNDLEEQFRSNALHYSLADLHYHKKEVEKAMLNLREVQFTDIFFTLDAKVMLLKIYYDNDEEEAFHSLILSFKVFLKRNKLISDTMRKTYQRFITLLAQLEKSRGSNLDELEKEITSAQLLVDRKWLLDALNRKRS